MILRFFFETVLLHKPLILLLYCRFFQSCYQNGYHHPPKKPLTTTGLKAKLRALQAPA
jgi:hypothetical protein